MRPRAFLTAGVIALALAPAAHALDPRALLAKIGFPSDTQERVLAGEFVETELMTSSERDLNVGIAFLIEAPPASVAKKLREEHLLERVNPATIAYGDFKGDGNAAQLGALKLTAKQQRAYAAAAPGDDLNLATDEIGALVTAGKDPGRLQDTVRALLLARYRAYRAKGLAGIAPYARSGSKSDPAGDIAWDTRVVRASKILPTTFTDLLEAYPRGAPRDLDESFYWSQFAAHGEDTIALVHVAHGTFEGNPIVFQRQYYVSTGYNALQAIAGFLRVPQGTLAIYTNHVSTDQVAGFGGGAKRSIGRRVMAGELRRVFDKMRKAIAR